MAKIITSLQHPLVKHLVKLRDNRHYRDTEKSVMIEGRAIVAEVCSKQPAKVLLTTTLESIPKNVLADEIVLINDAILQKISGVQSPDNLIAEVTMPTHHSMKGLQWVIAFDGISDPGNLGTLLRTALALGWQGAFLLDNSCDPFNDKALRAAKGATFRLPMTMGNWKQLKEVITLNHLKAFVADTTGVSLSTVAKQDSILLVLGSEAHGPSQESLALCEKICIPMPGEMESLNVAVAGGILMYLLKRQ